MICTLFVTFDLFTVNRAGFLRDFFFGNLN